MQHSYYQPYNSTAGNDSNPVPYIGDQPHSYTDPSRLPWTHIQQNDIQYHTGLAPSLPQHHELVYSNRTCQPMANYNQDLSYHMNQSSPLAPDYSRLTSNSRHAFAHRMDEDHTRTLRESVGPDMPLFRNPEGPRLRTAQACQKCRTRKAKCSGDHPSCERCLIKGLVCEYAAEGRVRGPNKLKTTRAESHHELTTSSLSSGQAPDSPYAFTEPSPSTYYARAHVSGTSRSQSELTYNGGINNEGPYSNPLAVTHRSAPNAHLTSFHNSSALGTEADLRYQHSPWAALSGYERFYDHPERYSA